MPAGLRPSLLGAILLLTSCSAAVQPRVAYREVDGILLSSAVTVTPEGQVRSTLWNESVAATAYELSAPVSVQIACYTTSGEFATKVARYQLRVTADPDQKLRKRFLEDIYRYWRDKPQSYLDSYRYLPADKSILERNGKYVLYMKPGHERPGATYLFYANGRVLELELKLVEGDGWGPLSSFVAEHLAFVEDGQTFDQIHFEPKYSPAKLMALYESGALR